tara:strand:- start:44 stop:3052 length:3009 start_codon:yes stop_codon:yes gene_type:complete
MATPLPTITPEQLKAAQDQSVSLVPTETTSSSLPQITPEQLQQAQQNPGVSLLPQVTPTQLQNNKVVPTGDEDSTWWDNHTYAWDSSLGFTTEVQQFMLRHNVFALGEMSKYNLNWDGEQWAREETIGGKLGALVTTPKEFGFPEDWDDLTPRDRQEWIDEFRQNELVQKYGEAQVKRGSTGAGSVTGFMAKVIADPSSLIALPATAWKLFLTTGGLGGSLVALESERKTGEVDPVKTAAAVVLAGTGGVVFQKGLKVLGQTINQRAIDKSKVIVHKTVDQANDTIAKLMASGKYTAEEVIDIAADKVKLSPQELRMTAASVGRNISVPDEATAKIIEQTGLLATAPAVVVALRTGLENGGDFLNKVIQPLSNYISNRSQEMGGRMKRYDWGVSSRAARYEQQLEPFAATLNKLDPNTLQTVHLHLMNENFEAVDDILRAVGPDAFDSFQTYKTSIQAIGQELKDSGYKIESVANYFNREVIDLAGLRRQLGVENKTAIDAIKARRLVQLNKNRKVKKPALSSSEEAELVNDILVGKIPLKSMKPSAGKGITAPRTIAQVTTDMLPYYSGPVDSMKSYARTAATKIEQAELFGKGNKVLNETGDALDTEASLGLLLNQLRAAGHLTASKEHEIAQALQIYFNNGQKSPSAMLAELKSLGYLTTLGNPQSTLTQIKDLGMAAYAQGLFNTVRAAVPGLRSSRSPVTNSKNQGLADTIAADFNDAGKVTKALNWVLDKTQFKKVDQFGKTTTLNAALNKWTNIIKSPSGLNKLREKYGKAYPDDFDQLVIDLKAGSSTPRTDLLAWHELTRTQPLTPYEMPVKYLEHPDGRIMYSLKSFMIKQLQLVRDDVIDKVKDNTVEAATNATRYAVMLNMAGIPVDITKDLIMGRPVDMDSIHDYAYGNLLSFVGVSPYVRDKYLAQGDVSGMIGNMIAPSVTGLLSDVTKDVMSAVKEDDPFSLENKPPSTKTLANLPFIGPYVANFIGGGRDRAIKKKETERMSLSP